MVSLLWTCATALQVLSYVAALPNGAVAQHAAADKRSEARVWSTKLVGAKNGVDFSEAELVSVRHRRLAEIGMTDCDSGEHVDGISFAYRDNSLPGNKYEVTTARGHRGGLVNFRKMPLEKDEYVTSIHMTTWKRKVKKIGHSEFKLRIGYIKFKTNKNTILECGVKSDSDPSYDFGDGKNALLYMSGSQGSAIDALQAHFIPIADF